MKLFFAAATAIAATMGLELATARAESVTVPYVEAASVSCQNLKEAVAASPVLVVGGVISNYTVYRDAGTAEKACAVPNFYMGDAYFSTNDEWWCWAGYMCYYNPPNNNDGGGGA